jgi:FkbM family methyltransferase
MKLLEWLRWTNIARLHRIEKLGRGGHATYLGNNRLLAKVVADDFVAGLLVQADDLLIVPKLIIHGQHEPEVTRYFLNNLSADSNSLDVGANFGYFSCLMAHRAHSGMTIGVEPDAAVYELLRDNLNINNYEFRAKAMHAAISDAAGSLTLYRRRTRSGNTSIIKATAADVQYLGEAPPEVFQVECLSIDQLLPQFNGRIDFIKIDVEGAEPLAIRGARRTIETNAQLRIVMEWSPGQIRAAGFDIEAFLAELNAIGFSVSVIEQRGLRPISYAELAAAFYFSGILLTRRGKP